MAKRAGLIAVAASVLLAGCGSKPAPPPAVAPPPPKPFRIVFPEGFTRVQMAERVNVVARIAERERHRKVRLSGSGYLAATRRVVVPCFGSAPRTNVEGFLFPATYDFLRGTTAKQLVRAQILAFCRTWSKVDLSYAHAKHLTPYDVLTIASMIEREASVPSERPLVAAVIYNRLHDRMPLGIDATLRYGLNIPSTKSILESQLHDATPYNTRVHYGLPPTPIASPGLAAIRAAAHPAHVDYLYYARRKNSRHQFFTASASAYQQFLAANGYG